MRQQQKTILEALLSASTDGSLDLKAEILPLEDLIRLTGAVNDRMRIIDKDLNPSTVQAWLKTGILPGKAERTVRNRLFSGADLVRLVVVSQLCAVGIRPKFAGFLAEQTIITMRGEWFAVELRKTIDFNIDDFIWGVPAGEQFQVWEPQGTDDAETRADSLKTFSVLTKMAGVVLMVNARMIVALSIAVLGEHHQAKLLEWKDKITFEIERLERMKKAKKEKTS